MDLLAGDLSMMNTPAPTPQQPMGMGGGLNDLFSLQGALPGSGYSPPKQVCKIFKKKLDTNIIRERPAAREKLKSLFRNNEFKWIANGIDLRFALFFENVQLTKNALSKNALLEKRIMYFR